MSLFTQILVLLLLVPALALCGFLAVAVPREERTLLIEMESQAKGLVSATAMGNAQAFATGDPRALAAIGAQMLDSDESLNYVVLTSRKGPSLVQVRSGWEHPDPADPEWARLFTAGTALIEHNPVTGGRVFQLAVPLQVAGVPWGTLQLGVSTASYDKQIRTVHRRAAAFAGLTLLLSAWMAFCFAQRITKPIGRLRATTNRLRLGDLSARASVRKGDEFRPLADAFNEMAESIIRAEMSRNLAQIQFERIVTDRIQTLSQSEEKYRALVEKVGALD